MVDPELTRRKVLSGMAVAGTAGALVGSGTVSLFSDKEASNVSFTGGVVKLDVDGTAVEVNSNSPDVKDTVELTITLPELTATPDTQNNPAWVWIRTAACPEPTAIADQIEVEVDIDTGSETIDGNLLEVLTSDDYEFRTGKRLGDDCLEPGEPLTVSIQQTNTEDIGDLGPVEIKLQVFAEQCRHSSDSDPPFDPVIEKGECETPEADAKALSFVSFCAKDGSALDPDITDVVSTDDVGDPTGVKWETNDPVDYVVAKAGQEIIMYDYTDNSDADPTGGTVESGDPPDADFAKEVNPGKVDPSPTDAPCQFAVEEFEGESAEFPADGTSTKLEEDQGVLEPS